MCDCCGAGAAATAVNAAITVETAIAVKAAIGVDAATAGQSTRLGHGGALVDDDLERAQKHAVRVDDHDDLPHVTERDLHTRTRTSSRAAAGGVSLGVH